MWTHGFQHTLSIEAARIDRYDFVSSANLFGTPVRRRHFFDLPPEIRAQIYMLLPQTGINFFGDENLLTETILGVHTVPLSPPIASTCKFLRKDVLDAYFSLSHFRFLRSGRWAFGAFDWVEAQPDFCISYMNNIVFESLTVHRKGQDEEDPLLWCGSGNHNTIRHFDTISIDVRQGSVIIEPSRLFVWGELQTPDMTCGNCNHVEYLEETAVKLRGIVSVLPFFDGQRRIGKEALKAMMRLTIGVQVDGEVVHPGMDRSHVFTKTIRQRWPITRAERREKLQELGHWATGGSAMHG
ncbi:uncharacterized protein RHO25_002285 [Cercospora beticola]|uniref:F-box domain-containing protein n=1 Tax=Cercospora beticola TaxID=122368 RepID=A0ABZ0NDT9_CERBT|nr:hypothetical protein RHO25_002285 [Cercospora beticola]CAK1358868.1 unnamed protein product [Cercospora beticola]